jgi:membrane-bound serine protease (ClpP class)
MSKLLRLHAAVALQQTQLRSRLAGPGATFTAVLLLCVLALPCAADVLKITIASPIQPITEEYIGRAIAEAERRHAEALLIDLRTPGGLVDSTREIVEKMLAAKVPIIVYVTPSGARAASAGFFILEAADVAAMAPGTNTGASHPVSAIGKMDDVMKTKVENDTAAFLRAYVSKRGRNVQLAETAVRESKSWTDQEALSQHLIDLVASSQEDLLKQLDGRPIKRFDGTTTTLRLAGQTVTVFPMSLRQKILGWFMDPNISFLLLALGALALYAEFNHPGAVVPGAVGVMCILLAVFALNLLPTRFAALTLIVAAFVLFALEAKYATHGVLAIAGIVALTMGGLLLVDAPIPELRVHLLTALGVSVPLGVITVFLTSIALKARRSKVATGTQGMIGEVGIARTDLAPAGTVFVHGELWSAYASHPVASGQRVRIVSVDGLHLEVEPLDDTGNGKRGEPRPATPEKALNNYGSQLSALRTR